MNNAISTKLEKHYSKTFQAYGATPAGVDWGIKADKIAKRYETFIRHMPQEENLSILDVGCGYGELVHYLDRAFSQYAYTGLDPSEPMINHARENLRGGGGRGYHNCTLFEYIQKAENRTFDCVVCCGLFTQKLDISNLEMNVFLMHNLDAMFKLTKRHLIFNVMSTQVNYFAENLFYKSPVELLSYCLDNFSKKIIIDHASVEYECIIRIER